MNQSLTHTLNDIPGLLVGHASDESALTGCTVVICPEGAIAGVDQRGGAPGTRETDLLRPMHLVQKAHAILLTGGSAFGLDAASGVMRYLEEQGIGFDTGVARVPIVPAAVIFDLAIGDAKVRPDAQMGYLACQQASANPHTIGGVGAGTGASLGKLLGMDYAMKSGLGSATQSAGDLLVSALMVANPLGDVLDPGTGQIIAGVRGQEPGSFANALTVLKAQHAAMSSFAGSASNTVIGIVATNARLDKESANKVAQMAQDGIARTVRPAHTLFDGDTLFCLATGQVEAQLNLVGALAAEVTASAMVNAVRAAHSAGGLPAAQDYAHG